MKLKNLLDNTDQICLNDVLANMDIAGISTNSLTIKPNEIFVAIPGYKIDGHEFVNDAIEGGAIVVIGEKKLENLSVPYIRVKNSRLILAKMACQYYGNPSKSKIMIGITGTNGKTTTSYMIKNIIESSGRTCSLIGTVMNVVNGEIFQTKNTTPDAVELQKLLALSKDEVVVMEVSSHGISQFRVAGIEFDYCLFTNLDHDHLDYHQSINEYFAVKKNMFNQLKPNGKAIINHNNAWGRELAEQLKLNGTELYIVGDNSEHDLQIGENKNLKTEIFEKDTRFDLFINMLGEHNVQNASMAYLTARKLGIPSNEIIEALKTFPGVPGRFEIIKHPKGANIVIDYAHTPNAFYECLQTAKKNGANRIFHIFGFRGNRDKMKRRFMINISNIISDVSIVTLDDLNEVSYQEMEKTLANLSQDNIVILDRTIAIKTALAQVDEGDWVFITGKGPETYQQKFKLPTSTDKETVQYLIGTS